MKVNAKTIFLMLTFKCNIRCIKCYRPKDTEMTKEMLDITLSRLNYFDGNIMIGSGENLIYPYLNTFIEWIKRSDIRCNAVILTNGLALDSERSNLYSDKIKWGITLDGFDNAEVDFIQPNFNVEAVKKNIIKAREAFPEQKFYLNYTLTNKNVKSLLKYVQFANSLNIKEVYVTELKIFENTNVNYLRKLVPDLASEEVLSFFSQISSYCEENSIILQIPKLNEHFLRCNRAPLITPLGDVAFCTGHESKFIGNIADCNIWANWNDLKQSIKSGTISTWCETCENGTYVIDDVLAIPEPYKPRRSLQ